MNDELLSRLGIQSWCFRKYATVAELIPDLRSCGVNHLEICGVHVDWSNPAETVKICRDAGVVLSAFGVNRFTADEAAARRVFEFAALAGIPTISADIQFEAIDLIEKLCAEYGKKLAHHNHGRKHLTGSLAMLDELFRRTSPNVGLCLDTAWMLDSGEDPVAVAEKYRERLYGLHLKDFVFDRAGKPADVVIGTGNLHLDAMMKLLRKTGFSGYLTIEYEGDKEDPVPALKCCVAEAKKH